MLVGPRALRGFRTATLLFNFARTSMPSDAPGGLSAQAYYDVIAFLLNSNGLNPDSTLVDADSIQSIALQ